jgi:hypothetical protein
VPASWGRPCQHAVKAAEEKIRAAKAAKFQAAAKKKAAEEKIKAAKAKKRHRTWLLCCRAALHWPAAGCCHRDPCAIYRHQREGDTALDLPAAHVDTSCCLPPRLPARRKAHAGAGVPARPRPGREACRTGACQLSGACQLRSVPLSLCSGWCRMLAGHRAS